MKFKCLHSLAWKWSTSFVIPLIPSCMKRTMLSWMRSLYCVCFWQVSHAGPFHLSTNDVCASATSSYIFIEEILCSFLFSISICIRVSVHCLGRYENQGPWNNCHANPRKSTTVQLVMWHWLGELDVSTTIFVVQFEEFMTAVVDNIFWIASCSF